MECFIAFLVLKNGGSHMNRRCFPTEKACRDWISAQEIPMYAYGYWIEAFDAEGKVAWCQSLSPHTDNGQKVECPEFETEFEIQTLHDANREGFAMPYEKRGPRPSLEAAIADFEKQVRKPDVREATVIETITIKVRKYVRSESSS